MIFIEELNEALLELNTEWNKYYLNTHLSKHKVTDTLRADYYVLMRCKQEGGIYDKGVIGSKTYLQAYKNLRRIFALNAPDGSFSYDNIENELLALPAWNDISQDLKDYILLDQKNIFSIRDMWKQFKSDYKQNKSPYRSINKDLLNDFFARHDDDFLLCRNKIYRQVSLSYNDNMGRAIKLALEKMLYVLEVEFVKILLSNRLRYMKDSQSEMEIKKLCVLLKDLHKNSLIDILIQLKIVWKQLEVSLNKNSIQEILKYYKAVLNEFFPCEEDCFNIFNDLLRGEAASGTETNRLLDKLQASYPESKEKELKILALTALDIYLDLYMLRFDEAGRNEIRTKLFSQITVSLNTESEQDRKRCKLG